MWRWLVLGGDYNSGLGINSRCTVLLCHHKLAIDLMIAVLHIFLGYFTLGTDGIASAVRGFKGHAQSLYLPGWTCPVCEAPRQQPLQERSGHRWCLVACGLSKVGVMVQREYIPGRAHYHHYAIPGDFERDGGDIAALANIFPIEYLTCH